MSDEKSKEEAIDAWAAVLIDIYEKRKRSAAEANEELQTEETKAERREEVIHG